MKLLKQAPFVTLKLLSESTVSNKIFEDMPGFSTRVQYSDSYRRQHNERLALYTHRLTVLDNESSVRQLIDRCNTVSNMLASYLDIS
ncbi:hypothetical protein E2C01_023645 [Portunus trituberculatus]|uniref:Uncharacterized protein n=1 Tax=Portunus trituberculatus TaxID=210409 RepID=A0A5B7EBN6_PORTR|nr:hypothetical protein [Portunus trituberculatus]